MLDITSLQELMEKYPLPWPELNPDEIILSPTFIDIEAGIDFKVILNEENVPVAYCSLPHPSTKQDMMELISQKILNN